MALVKIDFTAKTLAQSAEVNTNFINLLALNVYGEDYTALTNGIKITFAVAALFKSNTLRLYKNGLRLRKGVDYTEVLDLNGNGTDFTLAIAPPTSTPLLGDYEKANV